STFNVDPAEVERAAGERTVGVIPVHLFGLCSNMDRILAFARGRGLWVVEDAACAFGGEIDNRSAGTFGDFGAFSFHPRKSITTGEGGMLTTANDELDALCRSLRDHGASRSDHARHASAGAFLLSEYHHLGFNFRMTDLQGALGVAQMHRADWILRERAERARRYDAGLADVEWFRPQVTPSGYRHGYQAYVGLFAPDEPSLSNVEALHERRNRLMA